MTIVQELDRGPTVPPSTLRGRLRDAREWRGLDQADVAKELDCGRSTVSNYERGIKTGLSPEDQRPVKSVQRNDHDAITDIAAWIERRTA